MNCNICGKEFDKRDLIIKKTDGGTEYCICKRCDEEGVELTQTTEYYICKQCGFPHQKDESKRVCKFCGSVKSLVRVELTTIEEEMLDTDPQKLYTEKLGEDVANTIADWIESPQREEVGIRHKRDRLIDTATLVGLIISFFLLEFNRSNYLNQKRLCLILMIPTVLILISAPLFKKFDRKTTKKHLPIWIIYIFIAILTGIYFLITKIY